MTDLALSSLLGQSDIEALNRPTGEAIRLGLFAPDGPGRTKMVIRHCYKGDAATDPRFVLFWEANIHAFQRDVVAVLGEAEAGGLTKTA